MSVSGLPNCPRKSSTVSSGGSSSSATAALASTDLPSRFASGELGGFFSGEEPLLLAPEERAAIRTKRARKPIAAPRNFVKPDALREEGATDRGSRFLGRMG